MADQDRTFAPTPARAGFQEDNPQEDWGAPADEGPAYGANHLDRGVKTDAERGQGPKTIKANKDIVSHRGG